MDFDFKVISTIFLVICYSFVVFSLFMRMKGRLFFVPRNVTDKSSDPFLEAFINGRIRNLDDVKDFILSFRYYNVTKNIYDSIEIMLVRTKGEMIKNKNIEYDEKKMEFMDSLLTETRSKKIEYSKNKPFNDVPDLERNLIMDIIELSGQPQKDSPVFMNKIIELSKLITIRATDMEKLGKDNAESSRLTKTSFYFGVISFSISLLISCWDKFWSFLKLIWEFLSTNVFY